LFSFFPDAEIRANRKTWKHENRYENEVEREQDAGNFLFSFVPVFLLKGGVLKQLGIIIVCYQSESYIAPLLRSLAATVDASATVVVIWDNASSDATLAVIERERPSLGLDLRVLPSKENLGFMRGNNAAYAALQRETPCEVIALLNPDTVAHEGWWPPLVKALENPRVGSVASLLLLPDGTVNSCGNALHFLGFGFVQNYGEKVAQLPAQPTLFSGSGAALAFRPAVLEAMNARLGLTGIFWEELFLYADDTDLGWRLRMVGLDNALALDSRVTHDHRFWLQPLGAQGDRMFYLERNRYLLMFANFKIATLLLLTPWIIASELALALHLWKLYPHRLQLWREVLKESRTPAFRARRQKIQSGRTVPDRTVLRAMTGSIRHGAIPFRGIDRVLDFLLRLSHQFICLLVPW
jgi:GT2 family glycosyltransferase